jgi:hypothetical protein
MTTAIRVLAGLILVAGGLAGAGSLRPDLAVPGRQGGADAEPNPVIERGQIILRRTTAKQEIIHALAVRELGLFEAAAWFRELNSSPPECRDEGWRRLEGRCEGEKLCRQVIRWARAHMQGTMPTSQVMARVQELEDELEAHIARHGKVLLPSR